MGPEHDALTAWAGQWTGTTRTWFDADGEPEETATTANITSILGGRWICIDYQGVAMGKPHAGHMIVGFHRDASEHEVAWVDSFHTGTAMMMSVGKPRADTEVRVLGSYAAGPERWGWRTTMHVQGDELVIEATNITPAGDETPAVETRLRRS
jgi:hypothetical protein